MTLKPGIKFVYETKDGTTRVFKAVKTEGADEQVLNVTAIANEGYEVIIEKNNKIYGVKNGVETEIDVSAFLA